MKLKNKHWSYQVLVMVGILVGTSFAFTSPVASPLSEINMVSSAKTAFTEKATSVVDEKMGLYESLELNSYGLSRQAFEYALSGYSQLLNEGKIIKNNILSILDFSLPSGKKRLFVIDLEAGQLVFNTYAAHGRNSGSDMATRFSNNPNSFQSSLGFYVTGETYKGKHGESLRLNGEEEGINDNAMARGIVIHSAAYADEEIVARQGFIGRSQGCPALPQKMAQKVINTIKNGSCLFLYSPDKYYTSNSKILNEGI
jgi:hypothetical protein